MGFVDKISNILTSWRGQKRKREADDDGQAPAKQICTYVLTPQEKHRNGDVLNTRTHNEVYIFEEVVKTTECRRFEFKAGGVLFGGDNLNQLIRKYASAFFNSEGGVLLAGVNDDGVVKGVTISGYDKESIWNTTYKELSSFRPKIPSSLWNIEFIPVTFRNNRRPIFNRSDRYVVEFSFKKGSDEEIYETGLHEVFLRRDGGVQGPIRPLDIKNLVISKYNKTLAQRKIEKEEVESKKEKLKTKGINYIVID
ncbi:schlafen-like protein 1 [Hydractinia symbiolongicarpus]|uniref:schlafen-like protein 1 n=1 Tax=Hydractinia symbiolongicarpus TaxID=13093 RepID=UPI002550A94B|nr:schlafen-like protein 1 [Hydractinia symbiolongicarpus]